MSFLSLSQFKSWVKDNQADVVLVIGIILIALISFGLGRLTSPGLVKESVVEIEEPADSQPAAISSQFTATTTEKESLQTTDSQKGLIVASKNGKYYHWPWSSWAKRIKPENQIWFKNEGEAQVAGYKPASNFKELAPPDYKP